MSDICDWCDGAGCDACGGGGGDAPAESPAGGLEQCPWCDGDGCDSCDHKGFTTAEPAGGGDDWDELQEGFGDVQGQHDAMTDDTDLEGSGAAPLGSPGAPGSSIASFCNSYYSSEYNIDTDRLPALRELLSFPIVDTIIAGGASQHYEAFPLLLQATSARASIEARLGEPWSSVELAWDSLARLLPQMDPLTARSSVTSFLSAATCASAAQDTVAAAPGAVGAVVASLPALWGLHFEIKAGTAEKALAEVLGELTDLAYAAGSRAGSDAVCGISKSLLSPTTLAAVEHTEELVADLKRLCIAPTASENSARPLRSLDSASAASSALALGRGGEYLRALTLSARLALALGDSPLLSRLYRLSQGPLAAALSNRGVAAALGEVWARMHADAGAWPAAYSAFYNAFLAARDAGDTPTSCRCLAYAAVASVMLDHSISPLASRDARALDGTPGPLLGAVGELRRAFDAGDLSQFRAAQEQVAHAAAATKDAWLRKHGARAAGPLLLRNLIARARGPSAVISFAEFAKEGGVTVREVASLALRAVVDGAVQGWVDDVAGALHLTPLPVTAPAAASNPRAGATGITASAAETPAAKAARGHSLAVAGAACAAACPAAGGSVMELVAPEVGAVALHTMMRQGVVKWK